jgi:hypothetical protein
MRNKIIGYVVVDRDGCVLKSAPETPGVASTLWFGDPDVSMFATRKQARACLKRTRANNIQQHRFWPWMDEAIIRPVRAAI